MFTLDHDPVDGSHLIVASGELDLGSTSEMSAIFTMAAAGPQEAVVLDLMGVEFIDSSALGALVAAYRALDEAGGRLSLAATQPGVRSVLRITSVDQVIDIYETTEAAEAAITANG